MISLKTAAQIAGLTDYRTDEASDHPITPEERAFAMEIAGETADRLGVPLPTQSELDAYWAEKGNGIL